MSAVVKYMNQSIKVRMEYELGDYYDEISENIVMYLHKHFCEIIQKRITENYVEGKHEILFKSFMPKEYDYNHPINNLHETIYILFGIIFKDLCSDNSTYFNQNYCKNICDENGNVIEVDGFSGLKCTHKFKKLERPDISNVANFENLDKYVPKICINHYIDI